MVDDHPETLALITQTLTRVLPRADVIEATGAGDAIALTAMCRFDAIIVGLDRVAKERLAPELRAMNPDVPILLQPAREQELADDGSSLGLWLEENFGARPRPARPLLPVHGLPVDSVLKPAACGGLGFRAPVNPELA